MGLHSDGVEVMKRYFIAACGVLLLVGLAGMVSCSSDAWWHDGVEPSAVVEDFYQAVNDGDLSQAEQFVGDVQFMEAAYLVVGYIQSIEILDEQIKPDVEILYGHEVQRAWITVNVTLSSDFKEPTDWDWYTELRFITSPFSEGEHLLYLQKHDPEYRPEWEGEWIIRGSIIEY